MKVPSARELRVAADRPQAAARVDLAVDADPPARARADRQQHVLGDRRLLDRQRDRAAAEVARRRRRSWPNATPAVAAATTNARASARRAGARLVMRGGCSVGAARSPAHARAGALAQRQLGDLQVARRRDLEVLAPATATTRTVPPARSTSQASSVAAASTSSGAPARARAPRGERPAASAPPTASSGRACARRRRRRPA